MTEQVMPWAMLDEEGKLNTARERQFSGLGEIYSYSVIRYEYAPARFKEYAPYIIALVKLDEGPMVTAQITDLRAKEIEGVNIIGMRVEMVTRVLSRDGEEGLIHYGFKFRPVGLL